MRRQILMLTVCVVALSAYAAVSRHLVKTVAATGTPEQLSTTDDTRYRTMVFVGNRTAHGTNTSQVWLQFNSTNDVGGISLQPGERVTFQDTLNGYAPTEFYIDVETAGDGVSVTCRP